MNLKETDNELTKLNERLEKICEEYLLIGMANVDDVEGYVPLYMGEMTYEGVICHFSKILLQTAKESDKPLELVGRDLNLAMKMWLEEEGQKHEDNA